MLAIGGGIGGLTAAIALCQRGFRVTVIEKDPAWSVYGVGIIQQGNVLRAMNALGLLDQYLKAGVGFDAVEVYAPDGTKLARVPSPRLLPDYPANLGISRPALHQVLGDSAHGRGCRGARWRDRDRVARSAAMRGRGLLRRQHRHLRSGDRRRRRALADRALAASRSAGAGVHRTGGVALQPAAPASAGCAACLQRPDRRGLVPISER